ncbi:MAG: hypothetical protein LBR80_18995 [Deltaproteobacteria bacterium]|nr:hypothetical protein [Deltaproteobacteria bacterium]
MGRVLNMRAAGRSLTAAPGRASVFAAALIILAAAFLLASTDAAADTKDTCRKTSRGDVTCTGKDGDKRTRTDCERNPRGYNCTRRTADGERTRSRCLKTSTGQLDCTSGTGRDRTRTVCNENSGGDVECRTRGTSGSRTDTSCQTDSRGRTVCKGKDRRR